MIISGQLRHGPSGGAWLHRIAEQDLAQQIVGRQAGDGETVVLLESGDGAPRLVPQPTVGRACRIATRRKLALHGLDELLGHLLSRQGRQVGADRREPSGLGRWACGIPMDGGRHGLVHLARDLRRCGTVMDLQHRNGIRPGRAMQILEVERVINDAARQADKGQKYDPCRYCAHPHGQLNRSLGGRAFGKCPRTILAAEAKELLNAISWRS